MRFNLDVPKWAYDFKMWMLKSRITAEMIAEKSDVGICTVYNIMSGKRIPRLKTCDAIYKAFGYDLQTELLKSGINISKPIKRR